MGAATSQPTADPTTEPTSTTTTDTTTDETVATPSYAAAVSANNAATADAERRGAPRAATLRKYAALWANWTTNGIARVGSRQATSKPVWVTPEVVKGGFATGRFMAALHETDRPNEHFLTEEGVLELDRMLESRCYRIKAPENAALLVVVVLLGEGRLDEAEALMKEITPHFGDLRFYPHAADTPMDASPHVSACTAAEVAGALAESLALLTVPTSRRARMRIAMAETTRVWNPIKFDMLRLVHETCSAVDGKLFDAGKVDAAWLARAEALLQRYDAAAEAQMETAKANSVKYGRSWRCAYRTANDFVLCRKHLKRGTSLRLLIDTLRECVRAGGVGTLTPVQCGRVGAVVASWKRRHGLGTPSFDEYVAACPLRVPGGSHATDAVIERLNEVEGSTATGGLTEAQIARVLADVDGTPVPEALRAKVERARLGSVEDLIARGIIKSTDQMAALVRPLVAQVVTRGMDAMHETLLFSLQLAFSKRRSLLLLNLEHQVTLDELPWAVPLLAARKSLSQAEAARTTLCTMVRLALVSFPQTITPNLFIRSLVDVISTAGMDLALTNEIAADIFEDAFSPKYVRALREAAEHMRGTPYATYYALDDVYARAASMDADALIAVCKERAGVGANTGWYRPTAENGRIIEQQQILTTHNLAQLVYQCGLRDELDFADMAVRTWAWIVAAKGRMPDDWQPALRLAGNMAYAWRQLMFYVSMVSESARRDVLSRCMLALSDVDGDVARLLHEQCLTPLSLALTGHAPAAPLLGWVSGRHPLCK